MPYAGRICVLLSGKTLVQDSTISRVSEGCCVSTTAGESAQHTMSVFTAPLITFINTDDTHNPTTAPILFNSTSKKVCNISDDCYSMEYVSANHFSTLTQRLQTYSDQDKKAQSRRNGQRHVIDSRQTAQQRWQEVH